MYKCWQIEVEYEVPGIEAGEGVVQVPTARGRLFPNVKVLIVTQARQEKATVCISMMKYRPVVRDTMSGSSTVLENKERSKEQERLHCRS